MAKNKSKIEISLTDFVDFVCKSGSTKLTKVKQIKSRGEYSPATDFYRGLRNGIVELHENNKDKKALKSIITIGLDPKKQKNYLDAINGYKTFWGKKIITWFYPPSNYWVIGDLGIKVNPELGLIFGGLKYVVKLYLKSDKLTKERVTQILTLMEKQLRKEVEVNTKFAVLDVKSGKIFIKEDNDITLTPLLEGEAKSFETIWNGLK